MYLVEQTYYTDDGTSGIGYSIHRSHTTVKAWLKHTGQQLMWGNHGRVRAWKIKEIHFPYYKKHPIHGKIVTRVQFNQPKRLSLKAVEWVSREHIPYMLCYKPFKVGGRRGSVYHRKSGRKKIWSVWQYSFSYVIVRKAGDVSY